MGSYFALYSNLSIEHEWLAKQMVELRPSFGCECFEFGHTLWLRHRTRMFCL